MCGLAELNQQTLLIAIIVIAIIWGLMTNSEEGKWILFLGIVALLAWFGSKILAFLIYITYGAILLMLLLIGFVIFQKLFKE